MGDAAGPLAEDVTLTVDRHGKLVAAYVLGAIASPSPAPARAAAHAPCAPDPRIEAPPVRIWCTKSPRQAAGG